MGFRQDINGLRAIAVLPVIFFHAGIPFFSGGYLGVDVFFVISGFLITSNIIKSNEKNSFSLVSFYDKRIRRILPPLIFTVIVSLILSLYFMLPYDLKNFGQSMVASSLGLNNILLYLTSGYWSLAAEFKPLYHTWSLGVEEQYYFIIPLIIIILFNKKKALALTVISLFILSFVSSLVIRNPEFNFLIILTRFWELCAGSLLAIYLNNARPKESSILSSIGLLLIIQAYINPNILSQNQAIINFSPVLGTALIIAFTKEDSIIAKALSRKLIFYIGVSSYSIYLLHQPILAFLRLANEGPVNIYTQLFYGLLAVPLGYLSYKYIESPFRNKTIIPNKPFYAMILISITTLVASGFYLHKSYGLQDTAIFKKYNYGNNPQAYADRAYTLQKSSFTTSNKKMLIIGNSFARDFYNMLDENGAISNYEVIYLTNFDENSNEAIKLMNTADIVFYVSSSGMANTFHKESVTNVAIKRKQMLEKYSTGNYYYVGTKNFGYNNNFIRQIDWNKSKDYLVDINPSNLQAESLEKKIFSDRYISLIDLLRDGDKVRLFTDNHRFISFDTDHITKDGAIYLGSKLLREKQLKL